MKKIYRQYIKITNDKQISDIVFKSRVTLSVISILACLSIMLSTAFAFFSTDFKTNFTMIAATWDVDVEKRTVENEVYEYTLSSSGTASKGHCIIIVTDKENNETTYYTNSFCDEISIKIRMTDDCRVYFDARWGNPPKDRTNDKLYENGDIIVHPSYTPDKTSDEKGKKGESSETTENKNSSSGSGGITSSETDISSDKGEASGGTSESSDLGKSSKESTENTSAETSSELSDKSFSSTESNVNSESENENETTSTPAQSSDSGSTSQPTDDASSSSGSSSESSSVSGSESILSSSLSSNSTSASDGSFSSNSSSASDGVESLFSLSAPSSGDSGGE